MQNLTPRATGLRGSAQDLTNLGKYIPSGGGRFPNEIVKSAPITKCHDSRTFHSFY